VNSFERTANGIAADAPPGGTHLLEASVPANATQLFDDFE
jgi:hypothetical protein